jgi:hypothetical protein
MENAGGGGCRQGRGTTAALISMALREIQML